MFIKLLSYKANLTQVDQNLPAHNQYLQKNYEKGGFICSGPRIPGTGRVILCRAQNEKVVLEIIKEDTFIADGVADYELVQFSTADFAKELADLQTGRNSFSNKNNHPIWYKTKEPLILRVALLSKIYWGIR
ncbi:MAG: YciI family protein [Bacteroidota bacterium]|nr:YciI family protein [Bacteroidota bacterium]